VTDDSDHRLRRCQGSAGAIFHSHTISERHPIPHKFIIRCGCSAHIHGLNWSTKISRNDRSVYLLRYCGELEHCISLTIPKGCGRQLRHRICFSILHSHSDHRSYGLNNNRPEARVFRYCRGSKEYKLAEGCYNVRTGE
jgi:hypothetical protein